MSIQSLWRAARESFTRVRDDFGQVGVRNKILVTAQAAATSVPVGYAIHAAVHGRYGFATAFAGIAVWNVNNVRGYLRRQADRVAATHNRPRL